FGIALGTRSSGQHDAASLHVDRRRHPHAESGRGEAPNLATAFEAPLVELKALLDPRITRHHTGSFEGDAACGRLTELTCWHAFVEAPPHGIRARCRVAAAQRQTVVAGARSL